jgi:magnesium-transporting ATPase (P-type)
MAEDGEVDHSNMFLYHAKTKDECLAQLGLSKDAFRMGLSTDEAAKRLEQYGMNKLSKKEKITIRQRILHHVANILVGILVFVAIVSAIQAVRALIEHNSQNVFTNTIQVGLIVFVITYVYYLYTHTLCFFVLFCFFLWPYLVCLACMHDFVSRSIRVPPY